MIVQSFICVLRVAILSLGLAAAFAQTTPKPPIAKEGFLRAVEIGGLTEDELIFYVGDRGVDFKLTADERARVTKTGLGTRLLEAVDANYRGAPPVQKAPASGSPVSQDELLGWLRDGFDPDSIEQAVRHRGVAFAATPELSRGLEDAGVRRSLIGLLAAKQSGPKPQPAAQPPAQAVPPAAPPEDLSLYVIRRVKPVYPADAKKLAGAVRLKVSVNADGRVENVEPLDGHPALAAAAEQAVRKWIYEPPIVKGKPSPAETIVKINFKAPGHD